MGRFWLEIAAWMTLHHCALLFDFQKAVILLFYICKPTKRSIKAFNIQSMD
jgi:hypothetical protein